MRMNDGSQEAIYWYWLLGPGHKIQPPFNLVRSLSNFCPWKKTGQSLDFTMSMLKQPSSTSTHLSSHPLTFGHPLLPLIPPNKVIFKVFKICPSTSLPHYTDIHFLFWPIKY